MNCPYDARHRVKFAYGEMEQAEAEEFRLHVSQCKTCKKEVLKLNSLASLTKRIISQSAPDITWDRKIPSLKIRNSQTIHDTKSIWTWTWALTTMATSAVAVFLLLSHFQKPKPAPPPALRSQAVTSKHSQPPSKARLAAMEKTQDQLRATTSGFTKGLVLTTGKVELIRKDLAVSSFMKTGTRLHPGDKISATFHKAGLETDDGSRITLGKQSTFTLQANDERGERWTLEHGTVVCKVSPRSASRPFAIQAGPGVVTVKGTRFGLRLYKATLYVAVDEGLVEVASSDKKGALVDLHTGQQAVLNSAGVLKVSPVGKYMKRLISKDIISERFVSNKMSPKITATPSEPAENRVRSGSKLKRLTLVRSATNHHATGQKPKSLADSVTPGSSPVVQKPPQSPNSDAHSISEAIAGDTNWIFDGIRSDMRHRRWDDALRKLDNYLGDPMSPHRDEAIFLTGLCLTQLGSKDEAKLLFERYLKLWPGGKRAKWIKNKLSSRR